MGGDKTVAVWLVMWSGGRAGGSSSLAAAGDVRPGVQRRRYVSVDQEAVGIRGLNQSGDTVGMEPGGVGGGGIRVKRLFL